MAVTDMMLIFIRVSNLNHYNMYKRARIIRTRNANLKLVTGMYQQLHVLGIHFNDETR